MDVSVCIGSSCHLRGANQVVKRLQEIIVNIDTQINISLAGSFCKENCTEGVVVHFDGNKITKVNVNNIEEILLDYLRGGDLNAGTN